MLQRQKRQKSPSFIVKTPVKSIGEHRKVRELPRKMNMEEVEEPKKYENLQTKPVLDPFKSTADTRKVRELPRKMNIEEVEEPETMKIYRQKPRASVAATRKLRKFTDETNMQARNHENSDEICAQPVRHLDLATPAFYHYRKNPKCYHTVWGKIHPRNVTMDGIAALLKQQFGPITANINALSAGVQMLDAKYGDLTTAVENRLKEMESRMDVTQAQVAKMDELVQHLNEEMSHVEGLIKTQVEAATREMKPGMKTQNFEAKTDKRTLTAVIGNLEGIGSLAQAQAWLKGKLTVLQGPAPVQICGKGTFQGMMFAEFKDQFDRDLAVTLLKTAGLQHNGKPVWASQDRDPVERTARKFLLWVEKGVQRRMEHSLQCEDLRGETLHHDSRR